MYIGDLGDQFIYLFIKNVQPSHFIGFTTLIRWITSLETTQIQLNSGNRFITHSTASRQAGGRLMPTKLE